MNTMIFGTAVAVVLAAASLSSAAAGPLLSQSVIGGSEVVGSGEVQHSWNGRTYCWSEAGWKGPGWYRCGFASRRGLGWGGPAGWHGWSQETSSDLPVKRRGSGAAFRSTPTPSDLGASGSLRNSTPQTGGVSVAPLSGSRSSGGILNSPLTNPSATSGGSISGAGGAASSGGSSGLGGSSSSTSGSGGSTSSSAGGSTSRTSGSAGSTSSSSGGSSGP